MHPGRQLTVPVRLIVATAVGLSLGAGVSCQSDTQPRVVDRIRSPTGSEVALVARVSGGATTPWDWRVYVVPTPEGREMDARNQVFGASHVDSVRIAWRDARTLIIKYGYADIYAYRNLWRGGHSGRVVEMRLAPTDSSSVPPKFP